MLDIETIGTSSKSLIIAVGVSLFDPDKDCIIQSLEIIPRYIPDKFQVCVQTVNWWLSTNPELFKKYIKQVTESGVSPTELSSVLEDIISKNEIKLIWCNGIDFDIPILQNYFSVNEVRDPLSVFTYTQRRDVRQFKHAARLAGWKDFKSTVEIHNAECDANHQANIVCSIYKHLKCLKTDTLKSP